MSDAPSVYIDDQGRAIYRPSSIMSCENTFIAHRLGIDPMLPPDKMQERYDEGHLHEPAILRYLEDEEGWFLAEQQKEVEFTVTPKIVVRGHIDASGASPVDVERGELRRRVVDAKALSYDYFGDVMYSIDDQWHVRWDKVPYYAAQMTCYMVAENATGALAVAQKNLEDRTILDRIVVAYFDEPPMDVMELKARVAKIEAKSRKGDLPDVCSNQQFPCPFYHVLHNGPQPGAETVNEYDVLHALAKEFEDAKAAQKAAESRRERCRAKVLEALGERPFVQTPSFSIKQRISEGRRSIDQKRLEAEMPDVAEKYMRQGEPYVTLNVTVKK
jgi:hypothetical protein